MLRRSYTIPSSRSIHIRSGGSKTRRIYDFKPLKKNLKTDAKFTRAFIWKYNYIKGNFVSKLVGKFYAITTDLNQKESLNKCFKSATKGLDPPLYRQSAPTRVRVRPCVHVFAAISNILANTASPSYTHPSRLLTLQWRMVYRFSDVTTCANDIAC